LCIKIQTKYDVLGMLDFIVVNPLFVDWFSILCARWCQVMPSIKTWSQVKKLFQLFISKMLVTLSTIVMVPWCILLTKTFLLQNIWLKVLCVGSFLISKGFSLNLIVNIFLPYPHKFFLSLLLEIIFFPC
jgi:hypothetical protein